jgi:polysaccharide pyruvyl transferase WcaK-like protein
VGLFGLLGSGNIGNDASMESVLHYLRTDHPDAIVDAMCMGPESVHARFGIETVPLLWSRKYQQRVSGVTGAAIKLAGKGVDACRTAAWVRRHDVVIVPGMGVLETSLPLRPWGVPYSMFLLSASGRLLGTKVALVSVGATVINQRVTRWLFDGAARLAFYRSYRDTASRDAMQQRGLDTTRDYVFPDLVFGLPAPPATPVDPKTVGVGVMAYSGTNDHRGQADEIRSSYTENIKRFIRWLLDDGRKVRLLVGDTWDATVVAEILADVQSYRPGLEPGTVVAEPVNSFGDLMRAMGPAATVVATRYHNVMCAMKLGKPVISLGYSSKNTALMADMGMPEFSQLAHELDVDKLIEQFTELERRADELKKLMAEGHAAKQRHLAEQFALLSSLLFGSREPVRAAAGHGPAHEVSLER